MKGVGILFLLFILLYIGLRPIHGVFVDMTNYNFMFEYFQEGGDISDSIDLLFFQFTKFCSSIMSAQIYFFVCAALYILPLYFICKKWFKEYWFYGFLFLVISFSFWAYGTNGIRNGIATSLFLFGISREKWLYKAVWILIAIGFHKSMLLPTAGFIFANMYHKPKQFLVFWFLCIPLSLVSGGFWENLFSGIIEDTRIKYFTTVAEEGVFSSTDFRWDFLLYGSTAVYAGWYYIVKKKFSDKVYFCLFNTYIFANAFWILVIRANFSNRFAYLSWFMMALVIIYPLLVQKDLIRNQHSVIGAILLLYSGFTFFMYFVTAS